METRSGGEKLNGEILDVIGELIGQLIAQGELIARNLDVPGIFVKALHMLDCPMAMKDLGRRMHCDPSFVTAVADLLETRGLATREAYPGDRRIKNLVLTSDGISLRDAIEREFAAWMPWNRALTISEREQLLTLLRKMLSPAGTPVTVSPPTSAGEVTDVLDAAAAD